MDQKIDYERFAAVIKESGADLAGLQEVAIDHPFAPPHLHDPLNLLGEKLAMEPFFARTVAPEYKGKLYYYGIGTLSRKKILQKTILPLPEMEGAERRVAIFLTVEAEEEKEILFINTHLDCTSGSKGEDLRAKQMGAILEKWKQMGSPPAILTGDLNAVPASAALKVLQEAQWCLAGDDSFTFPSDTPEMKIDYIAFAPAGAFKVTECKVIPDSIASDHRPVTAALELIFQRRVRQAP